MGGLRTHVSQVPSFCREDGSAKGPAQPTKDGRIATEFCCEDGRPRAHPAQPAMPFPSLSRGMPTTSIDAGGGVLYEREARGPSPRQNTQASGKPKGPAQATIYNSAAQPIHPQAQLQPNLFTTYGSRSVVKVASPRNAWRPPQGTPPQRPWH